MFSVTTATCFVFIQRESATSLLASPSVPWVPLRTPGENIIKPAPLIWSCEHQLSGCLQSDPFKELARKARRGNAC